MPFIREFAVSLLKGVNNNDDKAQIGRMVCFVRDAVTYVHDPIGSEYVISPVQLIQRYAATGATFGDCDDHTLLLNSLFAALGIRSRFVGVKLMQRAVYDHVISSVYLPSQAQWYDIDPCVKNGVQPTYDDRLVVAS